METVENPLVQQHEGDWVYVAFGNEPVCQLMRSTAGTSPCLGGSAHIAHRKEDRAYSSARLWKVKITFDDIELRIRDVSVYLARIFLDGGKGEAIRKLCVHGYFLATESTRSCVS